MRRRHLTRPGLLWVPLAALACAASSWVTIPMQPVPITLQTFAVTLAGALLGPRRGAAAVLLWPAAGALGAPVLAGGEGGIAKFAGAGAGYLFAFPVAAWLTGWLAGAGWMRRNRRAILAMALGNIACLAIGGLWLAIARDPATGWSGGVLPFLPGAAVKALAAGLIAHRLARLQDASAIRRSRATSSRSTRP